VGTEEIRSPRRVTFKELATLDLTSKRAVVISATSEGNFSIVNRIDMVDDNDRPFRLFLKNAIVLDSDQFRQFVSILNGILSSIDKETAE
jgi:hypothetical protein